ncbi:MAG: cellulase family glycosylhydrolase [Ruminococcus sp.]|nr:cellulase family glycosylhydrolase [Ruminococcus sp.]
MKIINKALSAFTAAVMCGSICISSVGSIGTATAADTDMTAIELVDAMGLGWNLGNTFDCWNVNGAVETGWGNLKTTQAMIDTIHDYGFDSVRIPITWYEHTDSSTYDIDDDYLARIKEVIDYCYNNDMYVIINMHWDWVDPSNNADLWLNNGLDAEEQFITMWTEIATYFAEYDNHLVFEDMNEVWWESSSYTSTDYTILNTLNRDFVDTVRGLGGNNADRLLLLAGANADLSMTCSSSYVLPDDDMIAVDIHYYTPATFCVMTQYENWSGTLPTTTWGTNSNLSDLANSFAKLKQNFVDNGVPVVIGEYGVLTNDVKEEESIEAFLEAVAGTALETEGFASFLWDGSDAADMEYFSRKTLQFHNEDIGQIYIDLADSGYVPPTIDWVEVEIDENGKFQIGNATMFKLEFSCDVADELHLIGSGGYVSYWDSLSESNVQNAISISVTSDDTGEIVCSEVDDDFNVIQYGYINVPENVSPANVYAQIYWAGYNTFEEDGTYVDWTNLDSEDFPVLVKAYIPGVVEDEDDDQDTTDDTSDTTDDTSDDTSDTVEAVLWGDANDDGSVDISDSVAILSYVSNTSKYPLTAQGLANADVNLNGDGLSNSDSLAVQRYLSGTISTLPESYN